MKIKKIYIIISSRHHLLSPPPPPLPPHLHLPTPPISPLLLLSSSSLFFSSSSNFLLAFNTISSLLRCNSACLSFPSFDHNGFDVPPASASSPAGTPDERRDARLYRVMRSGWVGVDDDVVLVVVLVVVVVVVEGRIGR